MEGEDINAANAGIDTDSDKIVDWDTDNHGATRSNAVLLGLMRTRVCVYKQYKYMQSNYTKQYETTIKLSVDYSKFHKEHNYRVAYNTRCKSSYVDVLLSEGFSVTSGAPEPIEWGDSTEYFIYENNSDGASDNGLALLIDGTKDIPAILVNVVNSDVNWNGVNVIKARQYLIKLKIWGSEVNADQSLIDLKMWDSNVIAGQFFLQMKICHSTTG